MFYYSFSGFVIRHTKKCFGMAELLTSYSQRIIMLFFEQTLDMCKLYYFIQRENKGL